MKKSAQFTTIELAGTQPLTKIAEGGTWKMSNSLVSKYGWVNESDFAAKTPRSAKESPLIAAMFPLSDRDKAALDYINAADLWPRK